MSTEAPVKNTEVFDPADLNAPRVSILGGVYTLSDLTRSRQYQLQEIGKRITDLDAESVEEGDDSAAAAKLDQSVYALCDFVAVLIDNPGDVAGRLKAAYDNDEIGVKFLRRLQDKVLDWADLQDSAGEG